MLLLLDIGGSKTRVAVLRDGHTMGEPDIFATPATVDDGIRLIKEAGKRLASDEPIDLIVGGIAGPLAADRRSLAASPNLPNWAGHPIADRLEAAFSAPVRLANDTALAGLGEATVGAGRGTSIVVYITVSTGVGGVRILDGTIDRGARGFEIGHQIIDRHADRQTLEQLVGGNAFESEYGHSPRDVTDPEIWQERTRRLAIGLANTIVHWSPEVIVLGGSMMTKSPGITIETLRDELDRVMREHIVYYPETPELRLAALGDLAGLHGALALRKFEEDRHP